MILRDTETGELIANGKVFPISHSNIIVEADDEVAKYLVKQLGVTKYKLLKMDHPPMYLEHELN